MFSHAFDNFIALPCVPKACGLLPKCAWSGSSCFGKDTGKVTGCDGWLHNPGDSMRRKKKSGCKWCKIPSWWHLRDLCDLGNWLLAVLIKASWWILLLETPPLQKPRSSPLSAGLLSSFYSFCRLSYPWLEPGYNVFRAIERWAGVVRKLRLSFSCEGMVLGSWCTWLGSCPFGFGGARVPLSRCGGRCNNLIDSWDQWLSCATFLTLCSSCCFILTLNEISSSAAFEKDSGFSTRIISSNKELTCINFELTVTNPENQRQWSKPKQHLSPPQPCRSWWFQSCAALTRSGASVLDGFVSTP